jgi:nicotinate phosphoribosyltransferase
VEGNLIECQLIEGMLLNTINFQSLIATKTCRIWLASGKGKVMEFGLRRAQGPDGALSASRAAFIGGACGTSNTLAGKIFDIPVMGTMGHSWIMSFDNEEEAFENYAALFPDRAIFLIDTYDTLKSGIRNAIKVGKKLAANGKNFGVRLDSGDIHYLSTEVRKLLDDAGLDDAFITVSNDLDEKIIETLVKGHAPVDSWGVGTNLVTGNSASAFAGVYKLAARLEDGIAMPVMKFSDNPEKTTNPGVKQVWRITDKNGDAIADILSIDDNSGAKNGASISDAAESCDAPKKGQRGCFWHPSADYRHFFHTIDGNAIPLLKCRINNGKLKNAQASLTEIRQTVVSSLDQFDSTYKRLLNPHIYKVSVTEKLRSLKLDLIHKQLQMKS